MKIGYFLSSEEWGPNELIDHAIKAQAAGFEDFWISDHFHPWIDEQGHSPFVWAVIGALAQATPGMHVTTAVTCPTTRIHPAIIAQAAATASILLDGRFTLGSDEERAAAVTAHRILKSHAVKDWQNFREAIRGFQDDADQRFDEKVVRGVTIAIRIIKTV